MHMERIVIINKHCFGENIEVDGISFDELDTDGKKEIINEYLKIYLEESGNDYSLNELFKFLVENNMNVEYLKSEHSDCDQCGDWNTYSKLKIHKR